MTASKETITPEALVTEDDIKQVILFDEEMVPDTVSWKLKNFTKKGDNYACVVTGVEVDFCISRQGHKKYFVVKLNPRRGVDINKDLTNVIFNNEAKFYLQLLPELNAVMQNIYQPALRFPKCFHSSLEMRQERIYFEDLRRRNFIMFDRKKGMDMPHASLVLRELGRFHAASLLLEYKMEVPLEIKHIFLQKDWLSLTENAKDVMLPLLVGGVTKAIDMLKGIGGYERAIEWASTLKDNIEDMVTNQMKNGKYDVACHGDCWNNNILFRYSEEHTPVEVMLLDLQQCKKASPAIDLNHFMYTSLTSEVRKPNIQTFIKIYYDSFREVFEASKFPLPFTQDELYEEFRSKNNFGAMLAMLSIPIILMESDEVPDVNKGDHDIKAFFEEMGERSMSMLNTNPLLKSRFLSTFDEFIETGLIL